MMNRALTPQCAPSPVLHRIRRIMQLDETDMLLDVGSGDGITLCKLAMASNCRGLGVEVVDSRVEESQELLQRKFAQLAGRVQFKQGNIVEQGVWGAVPWDQVTAVLWNNYGGFWQLDRVRVGEVSFPLQVRPRQRGAAQAQRTC